jgi:hypothetical protein
VTVGKYSNVFRLLEQLVTEVEDLITNEVVEDLDEADILRLALEITLNDFEGTVPEHKETLIAEIDRDKVMFDMGDDWKITISGEDDDED